MPSPPASSHTSGTALLREEEGFHTTCNVRTLRPSGSDTSTMSTHYHTREIWLRALARGRPLGITIREGHIYHMALEWTRRAGNAAGIDMLIGSKPK
jgi:hypothetical protein